MKALSLPAAALVALLPVLPACTALDRSTLRSVEALSPLTADPAAIAVAVDLPDGLVLQPDRTRLALSVVRSDTGARLAQDVALDQRPGAAGTVLSVPVRAHGPLRDLQRTARAWKAEAPEAMSGQLSVSVGACAQGDGPARGARFSVAIRLDETGGFRPLLRDAPLSAIAGRIGPCAAPGAGATASRENDAASKRP